MLLVFGQFAFVSDMVETYCTRNGHGIQCTDDIITVMNFSIDIDRVNQQPRILIHIFQLSLIYMV